MGVIDSVYNSIKDNEGLPNTVSLFLFRIVRIVNHKIINKIMLRIAVQAKGRLFEETMALLGESDIKISTTKRTLLVQSSNFPIEVLFLRDDDIPANSSYRCS